MNVRACMPLRLCLLAKRLTHLVSDHHVHQALFATLELLAERHERKQHILVATHKYAHTHCQRNRLLQIQRGFVQDQRVEKRIYEYIFADTAEQSVV